MFILASSSWNQDGDVEVEDEGQVHPWEQLIIF